MKGLPVSAATRAAMAMLKPLGAVMPEERKRTLVEMLERHGVPLIEDDIYGDLPHDGQRPGVCKAYDRTGNVLLCSGFSKTIAPALRVGYCAPGRYRDEMAKLKICFTLATPTLAQLALAQFLEHGVFERQLRKTRTLYKHNVARMIELVGMHFPQGTRTTRPTGGFVLWVELPRAVSTWVLFHRALEDGVCFAGGVIGDHEGWAGSAHHHPTAALSEMPTRTVRARIESMSVTRPSV